MTLLVLKITYATHTSIQKKLRKAITAQMRVVYKLNKVPYIDDTILAVSTNNDDNHTKHPHRPRNIHTHKSTVTTNKKEVRTSTSRKRKRSSQR